MIDRPRLIEFAFPIKQASLDSVHEKNVRHGHISTLHIWPARRPLAACRAALIATLLPDPGTPEERQKLVEKIGGKVVQVTQKKKMPNGRVEEIVKEETVGGVLHWGRENSPEMDWFREEIRKAYGGRAPKVLDPFAGGGAIPLEAMRLGCEATAIDINPVAWFILKCTLEYPQKLAALESPEFMEQYYKGTAKLTKKQLRERLQNARLDIAQPPEADLAWHVRAWGWWVLQRAKADLERFYPVIDGKPTVAYLWARTVTCKNCRATIPLLKTRWLCKKDNKRVLLTMEPNEERTGVVFGVQDDVPRVGGNTAQRREHDKRVGAGTMSRSGATCPCCSTIMEMEDIRVAGMQGRLGALMTTVVVEGSVGKEFRAPLPEELAAADEATGELHSLFGEIPFGIPQEPLPGKEALGFRVPLYGFDRWGKLFTDRQLLAIGTFVKHTRSVGSQAVAQGYPEDWTQAIQAYLALVVDRATNYLSGVCVWEPVAAEVKQTFLRFALPITWDFGEANPLSPTDRYYSGALAGVVNVLQNLLAATQDAPPPVAEARSAIGSHDRLYDLVVTDPPYYDAIPYSDLMDFFYVWLRRTLQGLDRDWDDAFRDLLGPKWSHETNDGELVDEASRFAGDSARSRLAYEDGMYRAFISCYRSLKPGGRMVVVFANKQPAAWETLVSALARAGFVVDGSLPIMTEMRGGVKNYNRASLSSSVWLVCRKRPEAARPGWDTRVLEEMRENIGHRLRDFWDAGIRGPDFVWSATGPALEAYSRHPVVKKANQPDQLMTVSEFLQHVRRIVVDFVVGRVLSGNGDTEDVSSLDDVTTYYLLHRHDFGMNHAPVGACILYAVSCNLSDGALADQYDIVARTGGSSSAADEDEDEEGDEDAGETADVPEQGSGSQVKLKSWNQRKRKTMGYGSVAEMALRRTVPTTESLFPEIDVGRDARPTRMVPLIDRVHRLMHLWKEGDVVKVDEYLETSGMRHEGVFPHLLQALIELAPAGSEERAILESISNHAAARGMRADRGQLAAKV
jgi:putative DNA methylase